MLNCPSFFKTIISAPLMIYGIMCNFKDATKGEKASKHWRKLDLIFKQVSDSSANGKQMKSQILNIFEDVSTLILIR